VSSLFAVSCAPSTVYGVVFYASPETQVNEVGLYIASVMAYVYMCTNPFIYATKFDPVKRVLLDLIPFKKSTQPHEGTEMT